MRSETECALGVFLPDDGTTDSGNYGNVEPSKAVAFVVLAIIGALAIALIAWGSAS